MADHHASSSQAFTFPVALCFTLNFVLGTGFLILPWAFVQAGLLLSTITMIGSAFIADIVKDYIIDAMARAEYMASSSTTARTSSQEQQQQQHHSLALDVEQQKQQQVYHHHVGKEGRTGTADSTTVGDAEDEELVPLAAATAAAEEAAERDEQKETTTTTAVYGSTTTATATTTTTTNNNNNGGEKSSSSSSSSLSNSSGNNIRGNIQLTSSFSEQQAQQMQSQSQKQEQKEKLSAAPLLPMIKDRVFEVNTLCRIFLGHKGIIIYTCCLLVYLYLTLWAYTTVFSMAMVGAFPIPTTMTNLFRSSSPGEDNESDGGFTLYTIAFALIVLPMSLVEMHDQVIIQVTLTVIRMTRLFLMIVTSLFLPHYFWSLNNENDVEEGGGGEPMMNINGFHKMLPIAVYATILHQAIPDLSHPIANKYQVGKVFQWTFIITTAIYCLLGYSVGSCFGSNVEQSSNVNWKDFRGPPPPAQQHSSWIYLIISCFVVVSPALDILSVYPLNVIVMGNYMLSILHPEGEGEHEQHEQQVNDKDENVFLINSGNDMDSSTSKQQQYQKQQKGSLATTTTSTNHDKKIQIIRTVTRICAGLPPIIAAIFIRDLGTVTDYAGLAGVAITFCFPALLFIRGRRLARLSEYCIIPLRTIYDSYGSNEFCAFGIFWFGVAMIVLVPVFLSMG